MKWNKMSGFEIGDRVEIVGEITCDFRARIGVVTAVGMEFFRTKLTVRLADGTESTFWDSQVEIPPLMYADMIFDSRVSPPGLRSSTFEHHMQFICGEFDIYLTLTGEKGHKSLFGQVTANRVAPASSLITLLFGGEPYATNATDSLGEFKLDEIPFGKATLEVVVPCHRIVAPFQVRRRLDDTA